jgi:NAD(P)-dependent dehydrogenase (short-subunit alcohol dehydrogenase family)
MKNSSIAIVTGASHGIGRATALGQARDFSAVVLVARNVDELQKQHRLFRSACGVTGVLTRPSRVPDCWSDGPPRVARGEMDDRLLRVNGRWKNQRPPIPIDFSNFARAQKDR